VGRGNKSLIFQSEWDISTCHPKQALSAARLRGRCGGTLVMEGSVSFNLESSFFPGR
jgi:hypothetical protein